MTDTKGTDDPRSVDDRFDAIDACAAAAMSSVRAELAHGANSAAHLGSLIEYGVAYRAALRAAGIDKRRPVGERLGWATVREDPGEPDSLVGTRIRIPRNLACPVCDAASDASYIARRADASSSWLIMCEACDDRISARLAAPSVTP